MMNSAHVLPPVRHVRFPGCQRSTANAEAVGVPAESAATVLKTVGVSGSTNFVPSSITRPLTKTGAVRNDACAPEYQTVPSMPRWKFSGAPV